MDKKNIESDKMIRNMRDGRGVYSPIFLFFFYGGGGGG